MGKIKERKKYSENFERDYSFFMNNIGVFSFIGSDVSELMPEKGEYSVKYTFFVYDSQGKIIPCIDPDMFIELIKFKKGLNFWIKYWAEGYKDTMEMPIYYLDILNGDIPEWVYVAFENQIIKQKNNSILGSLVDSRKEIGVF